MRLVGLNGSLVTGTMNEGSDIDFYIATAPGRLYLTRALVTLVVQLTGWRRHGANVAGQICLNRFATTEAMDIGPHNGYHARVFSGLEPLWAAPHVYSEYRAANQWMIAYGYPVQASKLPLRQSAGARGCQHLGEGLLGGWLGDRLENWQRRYQQTRINRDPRTREVGSRIFIRDNELCFHAVKH